MTMPEMTTAPAWGEMRDPGRGAVETGSAPMGDGVDMHYRAWMTGDEDLLLVVHGLGGHGGWYNDLGSSLAARGLAVVIPDLRGFGLSGGDRGHVGHRGRLITDLATMAAHARRAVGAKRLHLLGHSMGAILAVHLARRLTAVSCVFDDVPAARRGATGTPEAGQPVKLASMALVNPWLVDKANVSSLDVAKLVLGGLVRSRRLWKLGGGAEKMTDNVLAHDHLANDSLWVREETSSFLFQVTLLRLGAIRAARSVRVPTLVVQGADDLVVSHEASRRLYDAIAAADKRWETPRDCQHDFQFGACRDEVDELLSGWCRSHVSGTGS